MQSIDILFCLIYPSLNLDWRTFKWPAPSLESLGQDSVTPGDAEHLWRPDICFPMTAIERASSSSHRPRLYRLAIAHLDSHQTSPVSLIPPLGSTTSWVAKRSLYPAAHTIHRGLGGVYQRKTPAGSWSSKSISLAERRRYHSSPGTHRLHQIDPPFRTPAGMGGPSGEPPAAAASNIGRVSAPWGGTQARAYRARSADWAGGGCRRELHSRVLNEPR